MDVEGADIDPKNQEAHLGINMSRKEVSNKCSHSISSNMCPYPPGFGPCTSSNHIHHLGPNHDKDQGSEGFSQEEEVASQNPNGGKEGGDRHEEDRVEGLLAKAICEKGGYLLEVKTKKHFLQDYLGTKHRIRERERQKSISRKRGGRQPTLKEGR
ncbi:hypothetical protein PIB30_089305 [Stylosanthes scabra]|uniref:Uncharacterized protein n=1 Tax=Stylosanthes scabra TaxID=79078 RepID=A0ABU6XTA7_9FABA|nr:hypothetical protein [Stylosanthes scabra]